jgi:large subunit ribosomal protein L29
MKLAERKASVLRIKTVDELKDELLQLKKEMFNLRFQKANMSVSDTSRRKWVRRKVALLKTLLNEKAA